MKNAYHLSNTLLEVALGVEDGRGHHAHDVQAEVIVLARVQHIAVDGPGRKLCDLVLQLLVASLLRRWQQLLLLSL